MKATIQILGTDLLCRSQGTAIPEHRLDGADALPTLKDWASRYEVATHRADDLALLDIGRELFNWLNPAGWAEAWARASGPRQLDIIVDAPSAPLARALLDAPWELLASAQGHLADDKVQLFELARRIGFEAAPLEPRHADVQLLFMAAAPRGEDALSFEAEETSILDATQRLPLHLVVEESGASAFLGERLDLDGPFEALHLSCHGGIHPERGPVLALEDETGALALTDVGQLISALGDPQALPLVFLSACRTAEQLESGTRSTEPFVRELVRAGIANVLGWDGSVYDTDALSYARSFYGELASLQAVPRAAAVARQALRQQRISDPQRGHHWHLARLYLGPTGGGKLAAKGKPRRKPAGGEGQFLDATHQQVPVAGRGEFVGRRRATQDILRAFRDGSSGVLVHGMGNLGKSSLAYRIATRHPRHEKVVVFGQYDALAIFDRLTEALPATARRSAIETWRDILLANPTALAEALETLLEGPFDTAPILLVIDDLERILEAPTQSEATTTPVQAAFRAPLAAVIGAFQRAQTESRLLITSRYRFSLITAQGRDLAEGLVHVPLQPMDEADRRKQLRAAARLAQNERLEGLDTALLQHALQLADGNPGLQAALTRPILAGENAVAQKALADIEHFQQCGVPPADIQALIDQGVAADAGNAAVAFFKRMAFDTYRNALTPEQAEMLRAACLFSPGLPIPRSAVEAAGSAAGVPTPAAALNRLIGLGLVDDWGQPEETALVAANPLARPLAANLDEALGARLADAALPELERHWREPDGTFPWDPRALETARLALTATAPSPGTLDDASTAAARFLFDQHDDARQALDALLKPALERLETLATPASARLLLVTADCAERLAEAELLDQVLHQCEHFEGDPVTKGSVLLRVGSRQSTRGDLEAAENAFIQAAKYFEAGDASHGRAIALGKIADIHHTRGELDEALRIRVEEQLPVYEKLGDVRSRAVTLGQIADIHQARGELDEALRIRVEEQLPVSEKLGDVRSRAITLGKITGIHHARGELDEALRILTEELLPVFEKLGDVRSRAVTLGKIADIHQAHGELDEALRIRIEEEMPVYEKLGDVHSRAVTLGQIADIQHARGELDEALRILTEELLPVFEKLGDVRSRAMTLGRIANIHQACGELDEALRILTEELLPVFEKLGDVRSRAFTLGKIAEIHQARGELDEALRILTKELLPVFERLGDVRSRAVTLGKIADIHHDRGELDEALRIRIEEQLPVYEKLGDVRELAVTLGRIADIHHARGELDEALRIRIEDEMPVYEKLGDVRSQAVSLGQIAQTHLARGELDQALDLNEQRRPIAEKLRDIDSLAHIHLLNAQIRLERGDHGQAALQAIYEDLATAYEIYIKLDRPDGIAEAGSMLAQILTMAGLKDEALSILDMVEAAFRKLGNPQGVAHILKLRELIGGRD